MSKKWIITSKIHIAENDFISWLKSSASFDFNIELYNCNTSDDFAGMFGNNYMKPPCSSIEKFYANELADMILSFEKELLILYYDKKENTLNFSFETNRDKAINFTVFNTAMLLSIGSFKKNNIKDMCLISTESFDNMNYAIEFDNNTVKIIKTTPKNAVLPDKYKAIYDILHDNEPIIEHLDKNIQTLFISLITKRLEADKEDIILFSSPERLSVISHDAYYFTDGKNVLTKDGSPVKNADPLSFYSLGYGYSMDKDNIYYKTDKVVEADKKTFFVLNWGYAKDKNNAYFKGNKICELTCNFRALKPAKGYATNNIVVFYNGKALQGSDPMAFQTVGDSSYNDAKYIIIDNLFSYFDGEILDDIDKDTLQSISKNFFKDLSNVYYLNIKLEGLNPDDVKVINEYYIADKKHAYYCSPKEIVKLEDVNTIGLHANGKTAVDNKNVYHKGKIIEGLNGAEVNISSKDFCGYLIDSNNVYYYTEKIDACPKTFKSLIFGYGADGNYLFSKGRKIREGNFKSVLSLFDSTLSESTVIEINDKSELGGSFKRFKNSIYYGSAVINNADANSFIPFQVECPSTKTLVTTDYAKDKNNIYFKNNIVNNADVDTFKIIIHPKCMVTEFIKPYMAVDKNYTYYRGKILENISPENIKPFIIPRTWVEGSTLIYNGKCVENVNIDKYRNIENDVYTDDKNIFYKILPIYKANNTDIMIISDKYVKLDNNVCYMDEDFFGNITTNLFEPHINSFDIFHDNDRFSFDRYAVYFKGIKINNISMDTFSLIGDNYFHNGQNIFCGNEMIMNADIGLFMLLGDGYATDGQHTYYQNKELNVKNIIHTLGNGYATDGIRFWIYGEEIDNPYEHQFITDILGHGFSA